MADRTFTQGHKISVGRLGATAGTTSLTGNVIDMAGYDAVTFIQHFSVAGTATDVHTLRVQGATATGANYANLNGAIAHANAASTNLVVELWRPRTRYLKSVTNRAGTETAVGTVSVIQSRPGDKPVTNAATGAGGTVVKRVAHAT